MRIAIEFEGKPFARGPSDAWLFLALPRAATEAFGTKARVSVVLTVGGTPFRVSAFPDGEGGHLLNFNKAMQKASGAGLGDPVQAAVAVDAKSRTVAVPKALKAALGKSKKAKATFDALTPSHKKAYVDWIEEAKRPETRARRVKETIARLEKGETFW